jgi:hypothetical protein
MSYIDNLVASKYHAQSDKEFLATILKVRFVIGNKNSFHVFGCCGWCVIKLFKLCPHGKDFLFYYTKLNLNVNVINFSVDI